MHEPYNHAVSNHTVYNYRLLRKNKNPLLYKNLLARQAVKNHRHMYDSPEP